VAKIESDRKPSVFIPTLYFVEGLPYTIVNLMSVVYFKSLGAGNDFIGLTSLLYLPWTIKLFWAPLVDVIATRRRWILVSQMVLAALCAAAAAGALMPQALALSVAVFAVMAVASATQDIAIDGYYLDVLDKGQQALYVGVRNAAYKVAWLFGSGALVYLAGKLGESCGVAGGWCAAFVACAVIMAAFCVFHSVSLPDLPRTEPPAGTGGIDLKLFVEVFRSYLDQQRIAVVLVYILIFRLGDALMLKMAQPFLLDPVEKGGLGMSIADVGLVYGTVGTIFLLAGGILGGWLICRDGLRRWLLPTAVIQNSAILLYWLLAVCKPGIAWVAVVNSVEQFSYGLGVAAYTVFLLSTVKAEFKAAHYAIATAVMALGVMAPGAVSGYLQGALGYQMFFLVSFLVAVPGFVTVFFLPIRE